MDIKNENILTINEFIKYLTDLKAKENTLVRINLPNDGAIIGLTYDMLRYYKSSVTDSFIIDLSDMDDHGDTNEEVNIDIC